MGDEVFLFLAGAALVLIVLALRRRFADFSGQTADDYADDYPQFDMRTHLNGKMTRCRSTHIKP